MKSEEFAAYLLGAEFQRQPLNDAPNFELALHRKKPTDTDQTEFELDLPGYGRVSVPRDAEHWRVNGRRAENATEINFQPMRPEGQYDTFWYVSIGIGGRIRRLVCVGEPIILPATYWSYISFKPAAINFTAASQDETEANAHCELVMCASAHSSEFESSRARGRPSLARDQTGNIVKPTSTQVDA